MGLEKVLRSRLLWILGIPILFILSAILSTGELPKMGLPLIFVIGEVLFFIYPVLSGLGFSNAVNSGFPLLISLVLWIGYILQIVFLKKIKSYWLYIILLITIFFIISIFLGVKLDLAHLNANLP
ncbi:MAG: hypothetical protein NT076_00985 [Candidatus Pacearchaeota archaeon]|nr:hypothetical protein [Candidatus Pacearchaeota archaeon]